MEPYFVRIAGEQKGPLSEQQITDWFHNGLIDRNTECKSESESVWKTVDAHFPALKYGTPPPLSAPPPIAAPANPPPPQSPSRPELPAKIIITDIDIPFSSVFRLVLKWMCSVFLIACCIVPAAFVLWLIAMAIFSALLNGAFSIFHR